MTTKQRTSNGITTITRDGVTYYPPASRSNSQQRAARVIYSLCGYVDFALLWRNRPSSIGMPR